MTQRVQFSYQIPGNAIAAYAQTGTYGPTSGGMMCYFTGESLPPDPAGTSVAVNSMQFGAALIAMGNKNAVDNYIFNHNDPVEQNRYDNAQTFISNDPNVIAVLTGAGLNTAAQAALFANALTQPAA